MAASSVRGITRRRMRCSPVEKTRSGRPSSHAPIRAERSTLYSQALPLSRNETVRPRDRARSRPLRQRPLNREAPSNRLAPLAIPQRATNHPEQPIERSKHDSQPHPEDHNARIDDEPLHHEAHRARATVATARKPVPGPHTARIVKRAGKRNTITKRHFQSNLSNRVGWHVIAVLCYTVSHNVNTVLLQHAPNLLGLLRVYASNTNTTLELAITVLNNFDLKRDALQPKNDFPAQ